MTTQEMQNKINPKNLSFEAIYQKGIIAWQDDESTGYKHTHFRCVAQDDGSCICEAICKNEFGSAFSLGWAYKVQLTHNPNWAFGYEDF